MRDERTHALRTDEWCANKQQTASEHPGRHTNTRQAAAGRALHEKETQRDVATAKPTCANKIAKPSKSLCRENDESGDLLQRQQPD